MPQTIRYEIGEEAHVIVLSGGRVTEEWAKEHVCDLIEATIVDFHPNERPTPLEQLNARLKHAGVTSFEIIEH